ncbi:MAG: triose-phosphate isomerase [Verrucomicrobiota bacterium]|nr:triose-phosphate isomerase [Verrucomicrobiota bacterium]
MNRDLFVVGNWKMYKTAREAAAYLEELLPMVEGARPKIMLAVPYTSISSAAKAAKGTEVWIGAQNMSDAKEGAFTGEIAALMLKEAGASFVLLGHSERRHTFGETNELIHRKVIRALQDDLLPILCIGETASLREAGHAEQVLREQLKKGLEGVPEESQFFVAYEPVWAIGTGKTATPKMAQDAHAFCRDCLEEIFGKKKAAQVPLLYGGSVKSDNVAELVKQKDIDGVLVGGASLEPTHFAAIVNHCKKEKS